MASEENKLVGLSTKEEEDNAWWSDYQASTKLKRKFKNREESDVENFDDLLGDLDNISQETDTEQYSKPGPYEFSPVRDSSRKSSTSGYDTLSSVCTTPDFKDTSESVEDPLTLTYQTSVGDESSRSSTPHLSISLSSSRDDCDLLIKDDHENALIVDTIKFNDNQNVMDNRIKVSDKDDEVFEDIKGTATIPSDNDKFDTFHSVIASPTIYILKDASNDRYSNDTTQTDKLPDEHTNTKADSISKSVKASDSSENKSSSKGKKQSSSISKQVKNTKKENIKLSPGTGITEKNVKDVTQGKQETPLDISKQVLEMIKQNDTIIEIKDSSVLHEEPSANCIANKDYKAVELVNTDETKHGVLMKKKAKEQKENAKKTITLKSSNTKDNTNVQNSEEKLSQEASQVDSNLGEGKNENAAKDIEMQKDINWDNNKKSAQIASTDKFVIQNNKEQKSLTGINEASDIVLERWNDLRLQETNVGKGIKTVTDDDQEQEIDDLLGDLDSISQETTNITLEVCQVVEKEKIYDDKQNEETKAVKSEKLTTTENIDLDYVREENQQSSKDTFLKQQTGQEDVLKICGGKQTHETNEKEVAKIVTAYKEDEAGQDSVGVKRNNQKANQPKESVYKLDVANSSSMVAHWTPSHQTVYQPQSMKSLLSHYFQSVPNLLPQKLQVSALTHQTSPGGQGQNYTSMVAHTVQSVPNPVQPNDTNSSSIVAHFNLTNQKVIPIVTFHANHTNYAPISGSSMVTHCGSKQEQDRSSPVITYLLTNTSRYGYERNDSTSSMVTHGGHNSFAAREVDHPSSLTHSSPNINSQQYNSNITSLVAHQILCNQNLFQADSSILAHVAPVIFIHKDVGGSVIMNPVRGVTETCPVSLSMLAHTVPIYPHRNIPFLTGSLISHYIPILPYMENRLVGSFASHRVNRSKDISTSLSEDKHLENISVPSTIPDIIEVACKEIDIITHDVTDDTSRESNTITNISTTAFSEQEKESQEPGPGLGNCRGQTKSKMHECVGMSERDENSSAGVDIQNISADIQKQAESLESYANSEQKDFQIYETGNSSPHDSSSAEIRDRTLSPQISLVSDQDYNRERTIMENILDMSSNPLIHRETHGNENDNLKQNHAAKISRSISLCTDQDTQEGLQKSVSSVSLKSEEGSLSGMESSLDGSLSSLVASPVTKRKPRPLVLRNHFSNIANKQQEQKYLPAPRLRRTSEESVNKSNTPKVKRKTQSASNSSDTKISTDSKADASKQTQIGSLDKISSDEGENSSSTEGIQKMQKSKEKLAGMQMTNEPNNVRAEFKQDMKMQNITKPVEAANSDDVDVLLTNFMNFEFKYVGTKKSVQVAGTFNDWIPEDLYNTNGDVWSKSIRLKHGSFQFKYLVDGVWMHDPLYPTLCDHLSNVNNVIYVGDSKRQDSGTMPKNTTSEALSSPTSVEEPIVGKIEIFLKDNETNIPANYSKTSLAENYKSGAIISLKGLASETAEPAITLDVTQGLINNIHESKIAPAQEQLPEEKAAASEIALTPQNLIVSDKCATESFVSKITQADSNLDKVCVKEPLASLANESLSTTHSCSMNISNRGCQEKSQVKDLKEENMGNTKSSQKTENLISNELLINVVNENIKKICLYPEYKSSDHCQSIVKQVLNLVVNSGDPKELSENIANEKLKIFLNPLSDDEIKKLCGDTNLENYASELIITPQNTDKELLPKNIKDNNKIKDIIKENIRIVRKLPSFAHDQVTQMSVKKVMDIIAFSRNEEIMGNLEELSLEYYTETEKAKFWLLKDESMNDNCMVDTDKFIPVDTTLPKVEKEEDAAQNDALVEIVESKMHLIEDSANNKEKMEVPKEIKDKDEENSKKTKISSVKERALPLSENLSSIVDKHLNENKVPKEIISNAGVSEVYSSGNLLEAKEEKGNQIDNMQNPIVEKHIESKEDIQKLGQNEAMFVVAANETQLAAASDNIENSEPPKDITNYCEENSQTSKNCSVKDGAPLPLSENLSSIVDKHLNENKVPKEIISNAGVSEVYSSGNLLEAKEEKGNQIDNMQNPIVEKHIESKEDIQKLGQNEAMFVVAANETQLAAASDNIENSEPPKDITNYCEENSQTSKNCSVKDGAPLPENLSSIVDKHLNERRNTQEVSSNMDVSEVKSAGTDNMAETGEKKKNQGNDTQNPTTKECSIIDKHLNRKNINKETSAADNVTDLNDVITQDSRCERIESIETDIAFEDTVDNKEKVDTSISEDDLLVLSEESTVKGEPDKDLSETRVNKDITSIEVCDKSTENKESVDQQKGEKDKLSFVNKDSGPPIVVTDVENETSTNDIIQVTESSADNSEKFDLEAHQKEAERVNLVGIINKNVSKYCKEKDYGKNETAQRKVRTIFNIITESVSAEEIYDKILLEGLQWFAEFHGDEKMSPKESVSATASPCVKHKEMSPSVSKINTERKDSIVSKILKEVNTPTLDKKLVKPSSLSPKIKKSQTFAGQIKDENEEKLGKCTITRDKASRKVRKYVRTSISSHNLDQLDQAEMKDNLDIVENKDPPINENMLKAGIMHSEPVDNENDITVKSDKMAIEEIDLDQQDQEETKYNIGNKDLAINEKTVKVMTTPPERLDNDKKIAFKPDKNLLKEQEQKATSERESIDKNQNEEKGKQEALSQNNSIISKHKSEHVINTNLPEGLNVNDKISKIAILENASHSSTGNSSKSLHYLDRENADGLSISNMERKQQSQMVQRSFAEALKDSRDKKKNCSKKTSSDENSIVARLLKEKGCTQNVIKKEVETVMNARDRTISECSDNIPDLCPITDDDEDQKDILDEELWQNIHRSEKEAKEVKFSTDDVVPSQDEEAQQNSFFMTDFDAESDNESFADAEEHPTEVIEDEKSLSMINDIEPTIRTLLQNIFVDIFDKKCCEHSITKSKETISEEVDKIVNNLVTHILDLVEKLVDQRTMGSIGQNISTMNQSQHHTLGTEHENICGNEKVFDTKERVDDEQVDSEHETDECETVYDVFDLSMKRLDFIEHSFKSIYPPNGKEETKPLAIEELKKLDFEDKINQIRQILASQKDSDKKLKDIDDIVNEASSHDEKDHRN
eukprot:GFUD01035600.1.p1 GENE.GFUD01035600.1~~GFUD01035600.1.p1  ORF type:complete len:3081 (-),score=832.05 GFUD01035600.1:233-9475(-)